MQRILLTAFVLIFTISTTFAENKWHRASYNNDPATTIVIGWSGDAGTLYYGTTNEGNDPAAYPMSVTVDRSVSHRGVQNHFVNLDTLTPNTVYYFVIQDDAGVISDQMSIKTMSDDPNDPISFISGGDTRLGVEVAGISIESCDCRVDRQNGNRLVSKLRPDFIAFNGDFVRNTFLISSPNIEWQMWFDDWELTKGSDGRLTPLMVATGNHEDNVDHLGIGDPDFKDAYNLFNIPSKDAYYALNFGGNLIRMYTLNTEVHGCTQREQYNWFINDVRTV